MDTINENEFVFFSLNDYRQQNEMIFVLDDDFREYESTGKYSIENYLKRLEEKRRQAEDKQE